MPNPLSIFHTLVQKWFKDRFGDLTDIQANAWPIIAKGRHALITAPTGSGKTLTAFLWALNQLITGELVNGVTRILYVSPLKALNNDIQRNLLSPLSELEAVFERANTPFPSIRVLTRSGDTPQSERRRMLRHPPEILITTPESLNLMLSSRGGRSILTQVSVVIMDEIHALISEKRGTYLMTAVDRLVPLSGEFQRLALSATVKPLETVAAFVGGFRLQNGPMGPDYQPRRVETVQSTISKSYHISVNLPEKAFSNDLKELVPKKEIWDPIVAEITRIIARNRSILIFVNSRKLCEKITFLINREEPYPLAYAHHGSLSRELRYTVEHKLKQGELKAIVATNSLELGIDIGELDQVVLIQSPSSISSALQRLGRAGHQVRATSRGVLFPTFSQDILEAAVLVEGINSQDIESAHPVQCPLDVLSQIIVSMTGTETWSIGHLYDVLKTSWPYHQLTREHFDLVLNMLTGRYAGSRIRELNARVSIDRIDNTIRARKGALLNLYMAGGVIPDRGYFNLRHLESNARIGELDEEFVWEAKVGQVFTLGTQNWKIERITHNDVMVRPAGSGKPAPPFWIAESFNRGFHFSEKIGQFMEWINDNLKNHKLLSILKNEYGLSASSSEALVRFLRRQKEKTVCDLPHRHHLLVEMISTGPGGAPGNQIILHTFWGGQINRPYAMALEAAWEEHFQQPIETYADNNGIYIVLPHDILGEDLLSLVTQNRVTDLIRKRLEGSGFFGARFRECAGRALLISHKRLNERMPLWVSRLKSKRLFENVSDYDDFPILLETWRTCLQDMFDLDNLLRLLTEIESDQIRWSIISNSYPSPMAMSGSWRQINEYMYRDDSPSASGRSQLREDLINELISSPGFKPDFSIDLIRKFEEKRQREYPGYTPENFRELLAWVIERILIPQTEWERLLPRMVSDHGIDKAEVLASIADKVVCMNPSGLSKGVIVALENAAVIKHALYGGKESLIIHSIYPDSHDENIPVPPLEPTAFGYDEELDQIQLRLVGEWLSYYGPISLEEVRSKVGLDQELLNTVIDNLIETGRILKGQMIQGTIEEQICDRDNFNILLRLKRLSSVPRFEPLPISSLPYYLANMQGLVSGEAGKEQLYTCIEQVSFYGAPAASWEADILPARLKNYDTSWLDTAMQDSELMWIGCGREKVYFCFRDDLDLVLPEKSGTQEIESDRSDTDSKQETLDVNTVFQDESARYDFGTLLNKSAMPPQELTQELWDSVWRGDLTNDTMLSLRKGIESKFSVPRHTKEKKNVLTGRPRGRRSRRKRGFRAPFSRGKGSLLYSGYWRKVDTIGFDPDLLEAAERTKERIRVLLERYGILFRELLQREMKSFQWGRLFRSLRLMELSGEIVSGYFFKDIPGPQFMSHRGFQILQRLAPGSEVYWMNAVDPASLCGIQLPGLKENLPRRLPSTHMVYRGNRLVLVSRRHGKDLTINVSVDDPDLQSFLEVFRHLMTRQFQPLKQITVEKINDVPADKSPFVEALRVPFDVLMEYGRVVLYRKTIELN